MGDTFRKFKPGKSTGGIAKPKIGGGGNSGMAMLMGMMLGQQQRQNAGQGIEEVRSQMPNKSFLPGAKASIGRELKIDAPLSEDVTLDEARATSNADAFQAHVQFLDNAMKTWPRQKFVQKFQKATTKIGSQTPGSFLGMPTTVGDSEAQLLNFALKDMSDRLLRLRSGAQINEQELQRLSGLLPTFTDVTDPNDTDYKVIRTKIFSFVNELNGIKDKLLRGQQFDESTKARIEFDPTLWNDLNAPGSEVNHPVYSAYLQSQQGAQRQQGMPQQDPSAAGDPNREDKAAKLERIKQRFKQGNP